MTVTSSSNPVDPVTVSVSVCPSSPFFGHLTFWHRSLQLWVTAGAAPRVSLRIPKTPRCCTSCCGTNETDGSSLRKFSVLLHGLQQGLFFFFKSEVPEFSGYMPPWNAVWHVVSTAFHQGHQRSHEPQKIWMTNLQVVSSFPPWPIGCSPTCSHIVHLISFSWLFLPLTSYPTKIINLESRLVNTTILSAFLPSPPHSLLLLSDAFSLSVQLASLCTSFPGCLVSKWLLSLNVS